MENALSRRTVTAAWLILLTVCSTAGAQQWAKDMFDKTSHNFGTVARGAKVTHSFTMENKYEEDAHIASIRTTCGCASLDYPKHIIKTWDKALITARLDTRRFTGRKSSTLTVVLDRPFPAEVQLHFHAYIRRDVVVQPGVVQFGSVAEGTRQTRSVTVDYAGRSDWKVLRVECANPHLQAVAVETSRSEGRATYSLQVTLKDTAPSGHIRDHLLLVTDDKNTRASKVPVPVEGEVAPAISVSPSALSGVVVDAGGSVTERLIVQGKAPFRIVSATCQDERLKCTVVERNKTLSQVNVTFTPGEQTGKLEQIIRIETDLAGTVIEVPVTIQVLPRQ